MSAIASQTSSGYKAVRFSQTGDSVAGRIVGFEDYQVTEYGTGKPKVFPSGDPIMGTRVHLETEPGNESSRVTLWVEKAAQLKAVADAFRRAGVQDLRIGDDLAMTRTGMNGNAQTYSAEYATAEEN